MFGMHMPRTVYCWRCRMELPMLTEAEWAIVSPLLTEAIRDLKRYRQSHGGSPAEARQQPFGDEALACYRQITGFEETNFDALYHHRLSLLGPDCHACNKPLRTPRAKLCAECGAPRQDSPPGTGQESRSP